MARTPWRDALDGKLSIMRELGSDGSFRATRIYLRSGLDARGVARPNDRLVDRAAQRYQRDLVKIAAEAEPFYWSHDMVNAVCREMGRFDTRQCVISLDDLPVESGIFWFSSPVQVAATPDPKAERVLWARAIMFSVAQRAEFVDERFGVVSADGETAIAVATICDAPRSFQREADRRYMLIPFLHYPLTPGETMQDFINTVARDFKNDDNDADLAYNIWAPLFLMIACKLLQRKIIRASGSGLEREARRQAQRAGIDASVQVIEWRKTQYTYSKDHVPALIDWSCRWSVRPHTRRLKSGKVVNVRPYLKGPEDKPFKERRERAHVVKR